MNLQLSILNVDSDLHAMAIACAAQEALKSSFALANKPEGDHVKITFRKHESQPGDKRIKCVFEIEEAVLRGLAMEQVHESTDKPYGKDDVTKAADKLHEFACGLVYGVYYQKKFGF